MDFYLSLASKLPVYVLIMISATGVIVGDYFAKKWSIDQKTVYFVVTLITYWSGTFFFMPTLLREGLVITSVLWVLFTMIGTLFIGLIIFKETLVPLQIAGVVLGVIAILLLAFSQK